MHGGNGIHDEYHVIRRVVNPVRLLQCRSG
jgi:hypothetical protein